MRFLTPVSSVPKYPTVPKEAWQEPSLRLTHAQVEIEVSRVRGRYLPILCDSYNEATYLATQLRSRNKAHKATAHLDILVRKYVVYAMEFDLTKVKLGPPIARKSGWVYQTLCKECSYPLDLSGKHHPSCSQYVR